MTATLRKGIKLSGLFVFCAYFTMLIYYLLFAEGYGRWGAGYYHGYNVIPFQEIRRYLVYWRILGLHSVLRNLLGNVLGFVPFGILVPIMYRNLRKAWKIACLGLEVSLLIEVTQLILQVGCYDVDDIIMNTLGVLIGYGLFLLLGRRFIK